MIGSLGEVIFTVSEAKVHTFQDMSLNWKANYAEHKIHNRKGHVEYTGLDAGSLSLTITLSAYEGLNPTIELERLRYILNYHQPQDFILEDAPVGESGLWVLEGLDETHEIRGGQGELLEAKVTLKLREYIE